MFDFDYVRERHIKVIIIFMLSCGFIYQNWGHTLGGIKHVVLVIITKNLKVLDSQHLKEINKTILDFGESGTLLTVYICIAIIIYHVLRWFDYDGAFREYDIKTLKSENRKLVKEVRTAQETLSASLRLLEKFETNNAQLTKNLEQLANLSVSIEALHQKSKKTSDKAKTIDQEKSPDLFDISKTYNKHPPRRKKFYAPKF